MSPQKFDSAILKIAVGIIGVQAEDYFKSSGISFEKTIGSILIKNLKDSEQYNLMYPIYFLTGTAGGDGVSRLMYGAQSHPNHQDSRLRINFDLLYHMRDSGFKGHFDPVIKTLFIGPDVIAEEIVGLSSILRHEIQHYFEQMNMVQGKMTLARITVAEPNPVKAGAYSRFFRMDELETHLRDLRTILNVGLMDAKDRKLFEVLNSEEKIVTLKNGRSLLTKDIYKTLQTLIQDSQKIIKNIKSATQVSALFVNKKTGGLEVIFESLPPPYSNAKLELLGLMKSELKLEDKEKIENLIRQIIISNEKRIQQIETELESLALKLSAD